ncbi:hypothetical protein LAZ67_9001208 [Cordylochernes scorpioides]|uniref:Receptor ligand binding region domain-containing protein n=1 Tax=Cordylochernes scorpioides TaxID=51811 RepID=A0ABY6KSV4_9ARAC|nr:hypothetical protein LAZ67_9001208 [Cordylochernes scorpioides]
MARRGRAMLWPALLWGLLTAATAQRTCGGTVSNDGTVVRLSAILSDCQSDIAVRSEAISAALRLAVSQLTQTYPSIHFHLDIQQNMGSSGALAAEAYLLHGATVFFGPACSADLEPVARMASYWDIPVFTAGGVAARFGNKNIYRTLTRLAFSLDRVRSFLEAVLGQFGWRHVALVHDPDDTLLVEAWRRHDRQLLLEIRELSPGKNHSAILKECANYARGISKKKHIKLGLMKNFVKAMDRNASGFAYLKEKCSSISEAKIKEGIFVGPQIRELQQDGNFQNSLNEVEAAAWNSFRNVCKNFLGSVKVENYRDIVNDLLLSYKALGCNMSFKIISCIHI